MTSEYCIHLSGPGIVRMGHYIWFLRRKKGAGEMAWQLRALTALPEVLSSIPSKHMVAHNHLTPSSGVSEDSYSVLTYNNK